MAGHKKGTYLGGDVVVLPNDEVKEEAVADRRGLGGRGGAVGSLAARSGEVPCEARRGETRYERVIRRKLLRVDGAGDYLY